MDTSIIEESKTLQDDERAALELIRGWMIESDESLVEVVRRTQQGWQRRIESDASRHAAALQVEYDKLTTVSDAFERRERVMKTTLRALLSQLPSVDAAHTIAPQVDYDALEKVFHDALPRRAQDLVGDLGHFFRGALVATLRAYVRTFADSLKAAREAVAPPKDNIFTLARDALKATGKEGSGPLWEMGAFGWLDDLLHSDRPFESIQWDPKIPDELKERVRVFLAEERPKIARVQ